MKNTAIDVDMIRKKTFLWSTKMATKILGAQYDALEWGLVAAQADPADIAQQVMPSVMRYFSQDTTLDIDDRDAALEWAMESYGHKSLTEAQRYAHMQSLRADPTFRSCEGPIRDALERATGRTYSPEDWNALFDTLAYGAFSPRGYKVPSMVWDVPHVFVTKQEVLVAATGELKESMNKDSILEKTRNSLTFSLLKTAAATITNKDFILAIAQQHTLAILDKALGLCHRLHNSEAELFQTGSVSLTTTALEDTGAVDVGTIPVPLMRKNRPMG